MKQTIKFLLKTTSVLFLLIGAPFVVITTISSFCYYLCEATINWADLKRKEYE